MGQKKVACIFLKRGRELMNTLDLKELRLTLFKELIALSEQYKHKN